MGRTVIHTHNLGKRYRLGELYSLDTLRDRVVHLARSSFRKLRPSSANDPMVSPHQRRGGFVWALRDVSVDIAQGQAVGIVGPNGAGKTTLLKLLSRITEPTVGWAEVHGRVGSLLAVGTGFHPELTGRENVYLSGAILGMRRKEIGRKFDQILDFAGIGEFIDTPVKRYSDGMRVRLGFAVAAHLEPEILLVDEVLAVGDVAFQRKCLGRMEEVTGEGRTILFVSHNMAAIQKICDIAYGLDHGGIFASGDVDDVISQYLERQNRSQPVPLAIRQDRNGTGRLRLTKFSIQGPVGSADAVQCGAPVAFKINYEGRPPLRNVEIEMQFVDQFGVPILMASSYLLGKNFEEIPTRGTFVCRFDRFPLLPGLYHINLYSHTSGVRADWIWNAAAIQVVEGDFYGSGKLPERADSLMVAPHDWEVTSEEESRPTENGQN